MKKNKKTVIAYLHTHWDPEWYRTLGAFNVRLVEIFDNVLEELEAGRAPSFYFDGQVYALLTYLKFRPEKESTVKKLIKEKKLFIGPFFASVDNLLVSGAALIKNLELGLEYSKKFNEELYIGYLSDTFGHSKGIFNILNYFKINNAIIWRGAPSIKADFKAAAEIKTTRLVYGYYHDILHNCTDYKKTAANLEKTLDKIAEFSGNTLLLPLGADHMAPIKDSENVIKNINKYLEKYEIILSNPFEYLKRADFSKETFDGEFLDNSSTYILQGVYSARISEKVKNAELQWNLFNRLSILNYFEGNKYSSEIKNAACELIKNHAHDSIYGCSLDEVHTQIRSRQISVQEMVKALKGNLIRDFKKQNLKSENDNKIGVFNCSNYPQSGLMRVVTDKKINNALKIKTYKGVSDEIFYDIYKNPMTEDFHEFYEYLVETDVIPPFSFRNIEIKKPVQRNVIGCDFIENEKLKLFVLDEKICALDKKTGKTYEDFIKIHSTKDSGDSYNYAPSSLPIELKFKASKIKLCHPIKSSLELVFEENIKLIVSLTNDSEFFDIEVKFTNKTKNRKLQLVLNTDKPVKNTVAEDSIGTIKRKHDPSYLLFENIPVLNKKEAKTNAFPMQRFVLANNVAAITKGLNEYEVHNNSIKITLLRSIGIISNPKNAARGVPAGPPIECPDMQELSEKSLCLAITFNKNEKELFRLSDNFYDSFVAFFGEFKIKDKTYLKNEDDSIFYGISYKNKPIFFKV